MTFLNGTYEEPAYEVLASKDNIQLRAYQPTVVAEVTSPGEIDDSMSISFRTLARYIFGNGISMTAPVLGTPADNGFTTLFFMPSKQTIATLPKPTDPRITLRELPARRVVAVRTSWFLTTAKMQEGVQKILAFAADNNVDVIGKPQVAYYNSPFTLPWLRRNEVMAEVAYASN